MKKDNLGQLTKDMLRKIAKNHQSKIPPPFDAMIAKNGFDAVYALSKEMAGIMIYVPTLKKIFAECIAEEARKEYNGKNRAELARKYGYCDRYMRKILEVE